MEAKHIRDMMEAYASVYTQPQQEVLSEEVVEDNSSNETQPDLFDYLLEYLVAEGYADTNKAALAIMANMSEEWKQNIVELMVAAPAPAPAPAPAKTASAPAPAKTASVTPPPLTKSPTPPLTKSPTPPLTKSPTPPLTKSPTPALTKSPTPALTKSPTPALSKSTATPAPQKTVVTSSSAKKSK